MKLWLLALGLILTLPVFGQTVEARQKKEEMLKRAEELQKLAAEASEDFEKMLVDEGCFKNEQLFEGLSQHLVDIGVRMPMFNRRVVKIRNQSLEALRYTHALKQRCDNPGHSQVDPDIARKELKRIGKELKTHYKRIKKGDTGQHNNFRYNYKFNNL